MVEALHSWHEGLYRAPMQLGQPIPVLDRAGARWEHSRSSEGLSPSGQEESKRLTHHQQYGCHTTLAQLDQAQR
jgi:hypothetical protein